MNISLSALSLPHSTRLILSAYSAGTQSLDTGIVFPLSPVKLRLSGDRKRNNFLQHISSNSLSALSLPHSTRLILSTHSAGTQSLDTGIVFPLSPVKLRLSGDRNAIRKQPRCPHEVISRNTLCIALTICCDGLCNDC